MDIVGKEKNDELLSLLKSSNYLEFKTKILEDKQSFYNLTGDENFYTFLKDSSDELFYSLYSVPLLYNPLIFEQKDLILRLVKYDSKYNNVSLYRRRINQLSKYNSDTVIYKIEYLRTAIYDDIMSKDSNFIDKQKEIICDCFFKRDYSYIYNMLSNIIDFSNTVDVNHQVINENELLIINQLFNLLTYIGDDDKILRDAYFNMKDKQINYIELLKTIYIKAKSEATQLLEKSLIKDNEIAKLDTKIINNVKIHELDGAPFMLLVRRTNSVTKNRWPKEDSDLVSMSLISDIAIDKIWECGDYLLGFNNIPKDKIINMSTDDNDTNMKMAQSNRVPDDCSVLLSPQVFIDNTGHHNEVLVKGNIYPSYICCYDNVREIDIMAASQLGIDILKINSEKYKKNESKLGK